MEELYCSEAPACSDEPIAHEDPTLLNDRRVLDNMLQLQPFSMPPQNYFKHIQNDIQPFMRKIVTGWMMEICEEQACEDQVFATAINFFDRFLCVCVIQKTQLQLVGAVCLLLASKLRQCRPLSAEHLAYYTEYSVSVEEIKQWELLLLSKLGWDLSPITACDFVDHLLRRVYPVGQEPIVRRHATTFVALVGTEPEFVQVEPSAIAVAAITAAVRGLNMSSWSEVLSTLASAVNLDAHALMPVIQQIDLVVTKESTILPPSVHNQQQQAQQQPSTPTNKQQATVPMDFDINDTPKDLTDIHF
ncbi:G1/S-specific cyclin-D1-like [Homarus americanus]|uniref:G1/S-specific cyclin-D1-like n=1 Tax=Homarus americanus TaxID=6706 RepID=UPI001C445AE8|nr:G1/S-specific cyclin-D1-like [Homarus americanus]